MIAYRYFMKNEDTGTYVGLYCSGLKETQIFNPNTVYDFQGDGSIFHRGFYCLASITDAENFITKLCRCPDAEEEGYGNAELWEIETDNMTMTASDEWDFEDIPEYVCMSLKMIKKINR